MPDTKEMVLSYLEENSGKFSSGEAIATKLNISRNSVWKAIESLRRDGFQIEAASRRGYSLSGKADKISVSEILKHSQTSIDPDLILVHDSLESTNKTAKSEATFDAPHGTVIIAAQQTGGTGHKRLSFSSPKGGIYMSLIMRPEEFSIKNSKLFTPFSVLSVCRAIEELTGFTPSIKNINDILLEDKKICGILTEAVSDFDTGDIQFIVVGIGIYFNIDVSELPSDIRKKAGSIYKKGEEKISINQLIARILDLILSPGNIDESVISNEYNKRLLQ
ncbi:biotin--[acetyl-CoA-carboxylase] ligase [Butyrivibrio sp. FC2001]|uniref:biotin--[acetyl-CoA-carboxylase] ligase n=1 Tax=Butyrivibrio sp. FC2001 TaxID=1280671 RepID=UPI00040D04D0|nr:biotin--[acetyl-CoA-carboxylase] ligase [Butyrivibrio sp. FC2001]